MGACEMSLKAMIIDEEPIVRHDLFHRLSAHNGIQVICEAGTIPVARKLLIENSIDVVFLDPLMAGGTGFDLVPLIDHSVKIVFIAACHDYAMQAFEINAFDYILKPVSCRRLAETLWRLTSEEMGGGSCEKISAPLLTDHDVCIKTDSGNRLVGFSDILVIHSIGGNYASVFLGNGGKEVCRKTLKEWEAILPRSGFSRIHRSTIVNLCFIKSMEYDRVGVCRVSLHRCKERFAVSRRMVKGVRAALLTP
jgi:two-component system LytT family response regulator